MARKTATCADCCSSDLCSSPYISVLFLCDSPATLKTPCEWDGNRAPFQDHSESTVRASFQERHSKSAIPRAFQNQTALAGRDSNSTCKLPFQHYLQVAIPTALSERHSNSTFRSPFQQHLQVATQSLGLDKLEDSSEDTHDFRENSDPRRSAAFT